MVAGSTLKYFIELYSHNSLVFAGNDVLRSNINLFCKLQISNMNLTHNVNIINDIL